MLALTIVILWICCVFGHIEEIDLPLAPPCLGRDDVGPVGHVTRPVDLSLMGRPHDDVHLDAGQSYLSGLRRHSRARDAQWSAIRCTKLWL